MNQHDILMTTAAGVSKEQTFGRKKAGWQHFCGHLLADHFIKIMQSLTNSNNNKLVHLYNICHKNKQSPSGRTLWFLASDRSF